MFVVCGLEMVPVYREKKLLNKLLDLMLFLSIRLRINCTNWCSYRVFLTPDKVPIIENKNGNQSGVRMEVSSRKK